MVNLRPPICKPLDALRIFCQPARMAPLSSHIQNLHSSRLITAPVAVLLALRTPDGSGKMAAELAEITGSSASLVSMTVNGLEKNGALVERRFPLRDGRLVKIYLTDEGRTRADVMHLALMGYQNCEAVKGMQET